MALGARFAEYSDTGAQITHVSASRPCYQPINAAKPRTVTASRRFPAPVQRFPERAFNGRGARTQSRSSTA